MEDNKETEKIDFGFEWEGRDFNAISPSVIAMAKKLIEMDLIKVKKELDYAGNINILHTGVCNINGLVDNLASGIIRENIYTCVFNLKPFDSLNAICKERGTAMNCNMVSCPLAVAGYMWYLEHKRNSENEKKGEFSEGATDNDIYSRNYHELKKLEFDQEIEELLSPLAMPGIKGLRSAFIGEEGTNKEGIINNIAKYLHRIGKISTDKVQYKFLNTHTVFEDDKLYAIMGIQEFLETLENNDDFSKEAAHGKKDSKIIIQNLVRNYKGKYIILDGTPLELKKFLTVNAKLPYIFDNAIYFKDYDNEKILEMFEKNLLPFHKKLMQDGENKEKVLSYLEKNRRYIPFKNKELSLFLAGYVSRKDNLILPKERYRPSTLEEMFSELVGMNNVKKQLTEFNEFLKLQKKLEEKGKQIPNFNLHMLFIGNPGTGKTTVARMVAKTLFDLGYIKENKCIEVEAKDLVAAYVGQTAMKTNNVINSALGGVLFIDEAYSLAQTKEYGDEAISTLVKAMEDNKGDLVIIFAGYTKEMQEFLRTNSGLQSRIGYTFEFADYTEDELYQIFKLKSDKIGFTISKEAEKKIREIINFGRNRKNFGNGRYVDNVVQKTLTKQAMLNLKDSEILKLKEDSIPTIEEILTQSSGEKNPDKIEELFSEIIGLDKIKKEVVALGKYVQFRNKLSKNAKNSLPDMRLHMLFTGDAGTGKTTMARKITEMLYNLGCIRINKLVEVERKDLVAEFLGQTSAKTEKVIESALGGVLFIDEAYSLTPIHSPGDYGHEAVSTLIKAMEDYKDEIVVIFAGYTKEMKDFVNSNSGIASRIGYTFEFENYNDEDLYKIFELKCKNYSLKVNKEVKIKIMEVLKYFSSVENFGNGRFVDKLLQEILVLHALNENLDENIDTLLVEDVPSIKDMVEKTFNNRENLVIPADIDMKARRTIAIHELGHAIIHYIYQGESNLKVITVVPEGTGNLGYVLHTTPKGKVVLTKRDYLDEVEELLAGRAAEEVFFGKDKCSAGCWNDLEKATEILTQTLKNYGMSETLGLVSAKNIDLGLEMTQKLDAEKKKTLDSCYENVKKVIIDNKKMFDKVLDTLMEKGTITVEEFVKILKK